MALIGHWTDANRKWQCQYQRDDKNEGSRSSGSRASHDDSHQLDG
eukprot:CAMPEP_0203743678 /NCGR_PEP_ID=MMETSP0098-20131031/8_1 /ASSEMBLY_ACC=CAM_ASM_000208 /TAXON_ID=96639 /ORGANISM=" , Strain NY0313808BC1" /LENGTH=44 /DNA_ID= /DNA_START= /DNA_END= /DNA_ORIENTATION=